MSEGAIEVTATGDFKREFHQCPNILRDRYLPLIKPEGYGYVNYLLSWANSKHVLSQRRQMADLGIGQGKLERIQAIVLEHCGHFIQVTVPREGLASRWNINVGILWDENTLATAKRIQERQTKVDRSQTGYGGVSNPDTVVYPDQLRGVAKLDTQERQGNTLPKKEASLLANSISEMNSQADQGQIHSPFPDMPDQTPDLPSSSGSDQHKATGQGEATDKKDVPRQPTERSVTSRDALERCFKMKSFLEQLLAEYPDRLQWLDLEPSTIFSLLGTARTQYGQQYATPLIQALDDAAHSLTRQRQEASQPATTPSQEVTFEQRLEAALRGEVL